MKLRFLAVRLVAGVLVAGAAAPVNLPFALQAREMERVAREIVQPRPTYALHPTHDVTFDGPAKQAAPLLAFGRDGDVPCDSAEWSSNPLFAEDRGYILPGDVQAGDLANANIDDLARIDNAANLDEPFANSFTGGGFVGGASSTPGTGGSGGGSSGTGGGNAGTGGTGGTGGGAGGTPTEGVPGIAEPTSPITQPTLPTTTGGDDTFPGGEPSSGGVTSPGGVTPPDIFTPTDPGNATSPVVPLTPAGPIVPGGGVTNPPTIPPGTIHPPVPPHVTDPVTGGPGGPEPVGPTQPGAVPEPASWATMMFGFALIGSTMRRRKMALT